MCRKSFGENVLSEHDTVASDPFPLAAEQRQCRSACSYLNNCSSGSLEAASGNQRCGRLHSVIAHQRLFIQFCDEQDINFNQIRSMGNKQENGLIKDLAISQPNRRRVNGGIQGV